MIGAVPSAVSNVDCCVDEVEDHQVIKLRMSLRYEQPLRRIQFPLVRGSVTKTYPYHQAVT